MEKVTMERKLQMLIAGIMSIVGAGLLIAGFIVEPMGEIHNSVLIAFGEVMTFVGAILGIHYTYRYKAAQVDVCQEKK